MSEYITLVLSSYTDFNKENGDIQKLQELLQTIGATLTTYESEEGHKGIIINYDTDEIKRRQTRGAGKKPKYLNKSYSIAELEQRIDSSNAEAVAKELDISRATLFRKIKLAKEHQEDVIW